MVARNECDEFDYSSNGKLAFLIVDRRNNKKMVIMVNAM